MGLNMADNLFTRLATEAPDSAPPLFVVCDVNKVTADTFAQDIAARYPAARVQVADSPAE